MFFLVLIGYLCDFNYYNEDYSKHAWYTNYYEK